MSKVGLFIIYNHRFDKNIPILEELYKNKFEHIYHIIPFYDGERENVISVYERSHFFEGYIAQAYQQIKKIAFDHYFFVADDMILHPSVTQNNLNEYFGIDANTSYLPDFIQFHESNWIQIKRAFEYNPVTSPGVEITNDLPKLEYFKEKFNKFGLGMKPIKFESVYGYNKFSFKNFFSFFRKSIYKARISNNGYLKIDLPLVGSYSDILIVDKNTMPKFAHYCGVFAASGLFVEIAIPTALVLSASNIVTEKSLKNKGLTLWSQAEIDSHLGKYELSVSKLNQDFPQNVLYIHPIKLSKWNK